MIHVTCMIRAPPPPSGLLLPLAPGPVFCRIRWGHARMSFPTLSRVQRWPEAVSRSLAQPRRLQCSPPAMCTTQDFVADPSVKEALLNTIMQISGVPKEFVTLVLKLVEQRRLGDAPSPRAARRLAWAFRGSPRAEVGRVARGRKSGARALRRRSRRSQVGVDALQGSLCVRGSACSSRGPKPVGQDPRPPDPASLKRRRNRNADPRRNPSPSQPIRAEIANDTRTDF